MRGTNRTRRTRAMRRELDEDQLRYFRDGVDYCYFWEPPDRERDWEAIREEILADWIQERPGTRPHMWWAVDAPAPRLRVGGVGDLVPAYNHPMNLKNGIFRK